MTWLDALLVILVVAVAALTAERRWGGVLIAVGGLLLLGPLLRLGQSAPLLALLLAVAAGLLLAVMSARFIRTPVKPLPGLIAGSVAGLVFGAALLLAVLTSLPVQLSADNTISYPPRDLPPVIQAAADASPLLAIGRTVTLQPLLAAQPNSEPASSQPLTVWLHEWLVPGEPWLAD